MKAISLWGPWALWVAMKWKTIETRTHDRFKGLEGQTIAIHMAKKVDTTQGLIPEGRNIGSTVEVLNVAMLMELWAGKVICTAFVDKARWAPNVGFVEREDWDKRACCSVAGKHLLFLSGIQYLAKPVPFTGRQGIFNVPDELLKKED